MPARKINDIAWAAKCLIANGGMPRSVGVLKTKWGQLDLAYLPKWAKELKVEDLLERVLQGS